MSNEKTYEFEGISQYRLPLCAELAGTELELSMDNGKDYSVRFESADEVLWSTEGEVQHRDAYECLKVDEGLFFINLEVSSEPTHTGLTLALDLERMLVTCVRAGMEGVRGHAALFVKTEIITGAVKKSDGSFAAERHEFTDELVGKAICWTYTPNFAIIHTYPTERYEKPILVRYEDDCCETVMRAMEDPFTVLPWPKISASPVDWIKLREGMYLLNILEISRPDLLEEPKRNCLTFIFDLKRMRNYGRAFGFTEGERRKENYVFTAYGKYVNMADRSVERDYLVL